MTEYQIVDLFLNVSTKQDALWAIFFSVHMAIFGGIIYVDRPLRRAEKIFAIAAYSVFAFMNFAGIRAGQRLMEALRSDLAVTNSSADSVSATSSLFESANLLTKYQEPVTVWIHIVAALLVIGAIVFDGSNHKPVSVNN